MDLLGSLGTIAEQISSSLRDNSGENAYISGDLRVIFEAIFKEVSKADGLVLSFVIDANLRALMRLRALDQAESLTEVDLALIDAFIETGELWRQRSGIIDEIEDPLNSRIVPEDKIDEIEVAAENMATLILNEENRIYFGPSLPGVTSDMKTYPWNPSDAGADQKARLAAFGAMASELVKSLKNPPPQVKENIEFYATLLATAAALVALFV